MILKSLTAVNFRNIKNEKVYFSDGINVLYGANAQGKTNTLEALYLFAGGRSFRTLKEKELVSFGKDGARVDICFEKNGVLRNMGVVYKRQENDFVRQMSIDTNSVSKLSEFLGVFRAVLFTPDHLELIKGAPVWRRHLIDAALCQIKPAYIKSLKRYENLLSQRNAYLRDVKYSVVKRDDAYLEVLSQMLADAGSVIIKQRHAFSLLLSEIGSQMYSNLSGGRETLVSKYVTFSGDFDMSDNKECARLLFEKYKNTFDRDISLGRTFSGPHRDDMLLFIAGHGENVDEKTKNLSLMHENFDGDEERDFVQSTLAKSFGSQGQQRSAALALKLSEGEIIKKLCGEYPVFLLDDLYSELDAGRRKRLSTLLRDRQTIISCCDKTQVPDVENINFINVDGGRFVSE